MPMKTTTVGRGKNKVTIVRNEPMGRAHAILIAIDQLLNTIFGGWPDETFSSRCWRWSLEGKDWPRKIVDGLFLVGQGPLPREFPERT